MHPDSIITHVSRHIRLSADECRRFTEMLKPVELARKDRLLQEAAPCRMLNYVEEGALRAYYIGPDGKEHTIMFAIRDWWITDMYCYLNNLPAMVNIEAIAPTRLWQLEKNSFDRLFTEIPAFERFFRILMQNAYTREQLRVIQNLSLPAEERYKGFLEKYPLIATQVTQKQIASYLGVTPEFLSTIRKKISTRQTAKPGSSHNT